MEHFPRAVRTAFVIPKQWHSGNVAARGGSSRKPPTERHGGARGVKVAATLLDRLLTTFAGQLHAFSVCEVQDGWRLAFPPFDAVIIHCVLRGNGSLRVGNGPWRHFGPQSIVVVPPRRAHALGKPGAVARESRGEEHCSLLGDGLVAFTAGHGRRDTLLACGTIAAPRGGTLGLFDLLRDPLVEDLSSSGVHRQVFDLMLAEVTRPSLGMRAMTEALMRQCLILLLRRHLPRDDGAGSPLFAALRHPRLARAVVAVLENPAAPHSVESLASLAGMSRASFAEHFSQAFQQGPIEFVQKARLDIAARLLATTDLPVKVIAGSIGYASRSYFSRAFRAAYGTDPSTFRGGDGKAKGEPGSAPAPRSPSAGVRQATEAESAVALRGRALVSEKGALSSSAAETVEPGDP